MATTNNYDASALTRFINQFPNQIKQIKKDLAKDIKKEFQDNFDRKSFFGDRWQPSIKQPTMVKSSDLKNSINYRIEDNAIVFLSNLRYSKIHNEGGMIRITERMRKFFWAKYYDTRDILWKNLALTKKTHIKIPQRKFLGNHPRLEVFVKRRINELFKKYLI